MKLKGSEIKRGSGNQLLANSSILDWILCGCNNTQRNVQKNLNSTHVLHLNAKNVINNCFDETIFQLDYNKVFYTESTVVTKFIK